MPIFRGETAERCVGPKRDLGDVYGSALGSGEEAGLQGPAGTDSELFNKYSRESGFPGKSKLV